MRLKVQNCLGTLGGRYPEAWGDWSVRVDLSFKTRSPTWEHPEDTTVPVTMRNTFVRGRPSVLEGLHSHSPLQARNYSGAGVKRWHLIPEDTVTVVDSRVRAAVRTA